MLCVTLTLAKHIPDTQAWEFVGQLVESLSWHPDAIGGAVAGFKAIGDRQVQGCLASSDETVGFILSVARSGSWGVHLTVLPSKLVEGGLSLREEATVRETLRQATSLGRQALRAPGGVLVVSSHDGKLVDAKSSEEVGSIEAILQLLCSIERRRSDEGQEAGVMINAGNSQSQAAKEFGVSQQAVSARLHAGYWYESRKVAFWLAKQLDALMARN